MPPKKKKAKTPATPRRRGPARKLLPFQIVMQPVVLLSEDGKIVGKPITTEPFIFDGHDAHEQAIAWLETYPAYVDAQTKLVNRNGAAE